MRRFWTAALFITLCVGACQKSQAHEPTPPSENTNALTLKYKSVGPLSPNVVVLLHGYGAQGDDLLGLAKRMKTRVDAHFVVPAAPFAQGRGKKWFSLEQNRKSPNQSERDRSRAALKELLRSLKTQGAKKIVLAGFSQGAMMSLDAALHEDDAFAGIVLFSGRAPKALDVLALKKQSIFVSHGKNDRVLSFADAERFQRVIKKAGVPTEWFAFEGGHTIGPALMPAIKFVNKRFE